MAVEPLRKRLELCIHLLESLTCLVLFFLVMSGNQVDRTKQASFLMSTMTTTATAVPTITSIVYDRDPYLDFQPAFAYSLPIQILLTGVILSLATVLLIHLIFTAPYHWTLAKLNYSLQLAGVLSLLLSLGVSLYVILNSVHQTSRGWPYMLNYVAVDVPLTTWTPHKLGWWYTLDAVTSGFVHVRRHSVHLCLD